MNCMKVVICPGTSWNALDSLNYRHAMVVTNDRKHQNLLEPSIFFSQPTQQFLLGEKFTHTLHLKHFSDLY